MVEEQSEKAAYAGALMVFHAATCVQVAGLSLC